MAIAVAASLSRVRSLQLSVRCIWYLMYDCAWEILGVKLATAAFVLAAMIAWLKVALGSSPAKPTGLRLM